MSDVHGEDAAVDVIAKRLHIEDSLGWWGPGTNWRTLNDVGREKYRVVARRILADLGLRFVGELERMDDHLDVGLVGMVFDGRPAGNPKAEERRLATPRERLYKAVVFGRQLQPHGDGG